MNRTCRDLPEYLPGDSGIPVITPWYHQYHSSDSSGEDEEETWDSPEISYWEHSVELQIGSLKDARSLIEDRHEEVTELHRRLTLNSKFTCKDCERASRSGLRGYLRPDQYAIDGVEPSGFCVRCFLDSATYLRELKNLTDMDIRLSRKIQSLGQQLLLNRF